MNRFLGIIALSFVVGCGSSSGEPVFGGFTPTGGSALIFAPTTCDTLFMGLSAVSGIVLDFTSYADSCDVLNETRIMCGSKASSTRVLAMVVSGEVGGTSTDPAGPGTYSFPKNPPTGTFKLITGLAAKDDASCEPLSDSLLNIDGGSITISSVSDTKVVGSTNMHFDNGQVFEHSFELPLCASTLDLCARFQSCGSSNVCVP